MTSYSSIVLERADWRKGDLHKWITSVNIGFSAPGIHDLARKKHHVISSDMLSVSCDVSILIIEERLFTGTGQSSLWLQYLRAYHRGFAQGCSNSIADVLELLQPCTKPLALSWILLYFSGLCSVGFNQSFGCYKIINAVHRSQSAAEAACQTVGATLASVETLEESNELLAWIHNLCTHAIHLIVGLWNIYKYIYIYISNIYVHPTQHG